MQQEVFKLKEEKEWFLKEIERLGTKYRDDLAFNT